MLGHANTKQYPLSIQNMSSIMSTEEECLKTKQEIKFTPDSRRYRGNIYSDYLSLYNPNHS